MKTDRMHCLMSCDNDPKELTFSMWGVLINHMLPPYSRKSTDPLFLGFSLIFRYLMREANKLGNLRQRAIISGCDSIQFKLELVAIHCITVLLDRFFPPNTLEGWMPSHYLDFPAVNFSNRLFVPAKSPHAPEVTAIPVLLDLRVCWVNLLAIRGCTLSIMSNTFRCWQNLSLPLHQSLSMMVTLCRLISASMWFLPAWIVRTVLLSRFVLSLYWTVLIQCYALTAFHSLLILLVRNYLSSLSVKLHLIKHCLHPLCPNVSGMIVLTSRMLIGWER